jgi:hypothetical protein
MGRGKQPTGAMSKMLVAPVLFFDIAAERLDI